MWHQMLAQKGYIIWICDNRTASGKGVESTWPVYKNFGELELRDLEDGFTWLKSQPYVDGSRIGIWGWSYGGFMTSYALTHSQTFKIGIAGGTVSDWRELRHDLHRALHGHAAEQSRRLPEEFAGALRERTCTASCC